MLVKLGAAVEVVGFATELATAGVRAPEPSVGPVGSIVEPAGPARIATQLAVAAVRGAEVVAVGSVGPAG